MKMKIKKILIVGDFLDGSGLTEFIFNTFPWITKNKYQVSIMKYGEGADIDTIKKCRKYHWNINRVIPVTQNPVKHWLCWLKFLKNNNFDIIYFNYSSSWNFLPVYFAKKLTDAKIVIHSHNTYYSHEFKSQILMKILGFLNILGKKIFIKFSDLKLATSFAAADWMFLKRNRFQVNIINNGIDVSDFLYNENYRKKLRKNNHITNNQFVIGFVGALQSRKNPILALKIIKKFLEFYPDTIFVMIGKGKLKNKVKKTIHDLKLDNDVLLIPYSNEVNKWYSAMDALIFPSKYEGFGLVPLEAQISNVKVLVSPGIPNSLYLSNNIEKVANWNIDDWVKKLITIRKKYVNFDRKHLDDNLKKIDIKYQNKKISNLLDSLFI